jgi:hypothetical protein
MTARPTMHCKYAEFFCELAILGEILYSFGESSSKSCYINPGGKTATPVFKFAVIKGIVLAENQCCGAASFLCGSG